MELVHGKTGVARVIAKFVLLGLFIILFAKAILALLALAFVGLLVFCCARSLYRRRARLRLLVFRLQELVRSANAVACGFVAVLLAIVKQLLLAAWLVLWTFSRLVLGGYALLRPTVMTGCGIVWDWVVQLQSVIAVVLACLFGFSRRIVGFWLLLPVRVCRTLARAATFLWVAIRNHAHIIFGTVLEAASGALVGVLVLNLPSIDGLAFLPDVSVLGPRVCVAGAFGAFLGAILSLSRVRWSREETDLLKTHA
jgi:hypothetical protein